MMMRRFLGTAFVLLAGCARAGDRATARVSVEFVDRAAPAALARWFDSPPARAFAAPATVDDFDCVGLNVWGPGLVRNGRPFVPGCRSQGATSALGPASTSELSLLVPTGASRTIQVFGVKGDHGSGCPGLGRIYGDVERDYYANHAGQTLPWKAYALGSRTLDLFRDTTVDIDNSYVSTSVKDAFYDNRPECLQSNGGDGSLPLELFGASTSFINDPFAQGYPAASLPTAAAGSGTAIANFAIIEDPANTVPIASTTTVGGLGPYLDLNFRADSGLVAADFNAYTKFRLRLRAAGGLTGSASCANLVSGGNGMIAKLFVPSSSFSTSWIYTFANSIISYDQQHSTSPGSSRYAISGNPHSFVLRLQSQDSGSGSNCSRIEVYYAALSLLR